MSTLEQALNDSRVVGSTAAEKLSVLLADLAGSGDRQGYGWSGVDAALFMGGVDAITVFRLHSEFRDLVGGAALSDSLGSKGGIDFGNPEYRMLIAGQKALNPEWVWPVFDVLLAIGAPRKLWQVLEVDSEPTLEQVTTAMAKNAVSEKWAQVQFELVPPMLTAGASWEDIKAAIAES